MLEFKKSRVILILAAFLTFSVTTNVWAFNPFQDLQTNPPTGKNYSVLPVWYSTADYKTKITVTNTDEDQSVIAFVDIMDGDRELRHFFIYLPPNDSWTGEIRGETPRVYSEDDSIVVDMGNFASEANPVDFPFPTSAAGTSSGYIKVVEVLAPFVGQDADNYAVFFSHFFSEHAFRLHEVPTADDFDAYPNSGILEVCEEIIHVETGETFSYCDDNTKIAPGAPFVTLDVDG
ncbi:MAG: hypothetical protein GY859_03830, partial [Desulfobacterales bacterium]|nr:hypothetical protein [Desulfobacterales bacterium]